MTDINTYNNCAKIKVIGVGDGGSNAVDRMIEYGLKGIEFISVNTNKQALANSKAPIKILLGEKIARGLGAGGRPEIGMNAAENSKGEISQAIDDADMLFITAGMGCGTGTGASPVIAEIAKSKGIFTIGVVTKPYHFEGRKKRKRALEGIEKLKDHVGTIVVISNQKLLEIENIDRLPSIDDYFKKSDEILHQGVKVITDLITTPSLISLDFLDIRAIMSDKGFVSLGIGRATGNHRFESAAMGAIKNSLLETSIHGTANALLSISCDKNACCSDINKAVDLVFETLEIDEDAEIIFGSYVNDDLEDEAIVAILLIGVQPEENAESFVYNGNIDDIDIDRSFKLVPYIPIRKRRK